MVEAGPGDSARVTLFTDLIADSALAVQLGARAGELAWTTHARATLPGAVLEADLGFRGAAIH